jgi:hypothetical protein
VEIPADMMMSVPPMVGVPAFSRWLSGPSARTTCPTLSRLSHRMVIGPRKKARMRAVTTAPAARKVKYRNTLNRMWTSENWWR